MPLLYEGNINGRAICSAPKDGDLARGGGRIGGGLVYGEVKDEMESNITVDRNIDGFDAVEQVSDIFR